MRITISARQAFKLHLLILLCAGVLTASAQGLRRPVHPPGVVPIHEPVYQGLERFFVDSTLFESRFSHFSRKVSLDSTQKFIDIEEKLFRRDYRLPVRMDLDYFVKSKLAFDNRQKWRETVLKYLKQQQEVGGGGIELNIPVRIKSKAFKRIFGGDRVGLRVTGNITFELAGRTEDHSGSAVSSFEERGTFTPKFKQTQQFRVEGRVGDKVSVSVDQNSEATFDLENTLKLIYTGDEDEIIQKIEAGNVALSLPSTRYVSTTANHQGLFGFKTQMQLGNFHFTGIASLERGEKEKITKTGSARENTFPIKDYEYVRNRFFFVDSALYLTQFERFDNQMRPIVDDNNRIVQLDVWKSTSYTDPERRNGYAAVNPNRYISGQDSLLEEPGRVEKALFRRLKYPEDYDYDELRGYFWLNEVVSEQDIIAIAYKTASGYQEGMLFQDLEDSTVVILKMIKPRAAKPEYKSTWPLMMKNVYNLGASGISSDGFDVKVVYYKQGEDLDVQPVPPQETFNYLMGLDRLNEQGVPVEGGDQRIDVGNGYIFNLKDGYLIFPSLTPFAPSQQSNFKIDTSLYVPIYNIKDRTQEQALSNFEIQVTTSSVSTTYDLGFNVLEGSEEVRLNGRVLQRDKDYIIDYFSGQLQIITPEARRADAQIEIEYERGALFQLDKKTLLGGRLEYEFGQDNFIGLTALYFNQSTLDQRIRLGQEPIRNFIWDVNTALTFRPNFLTKMFDKLPIVETSAESKLKIEAEYAEVSPNPNTFNEPKLGDNKGVAYIDDFEGSKRYTSLGITYRTWSPASIPARFRRLGTLVDYEIPINDDDLILRMDRNRVKMNWYNPFTQVPIKEIWPNKDVNAQTGTTTNVLNIRWVNPNASPDSAWAGIMRSTVTFPDQKKSKYIELWVRGEVGQINIDIGRISEDYWVRGKVSTDPNAPPSLRNLNTEDFNKNGLLDEGEDVGIDGIPDGFPGDDPDDNWAPPKATDPPFWQINGTEGNGEARGARYPDTEDLDGDGGLNIFNDYFEYNIDLSDHTNPYIQGETRYEDGTLTGWKLYRIPIRNYDFKVGNPDTNFQEIFHVRLWINNLPQDDTLRLIQIATFEFVGNEWEEEGVALTDSSQFVKNDDFFTIAVYNTEENTVSIAGGPEAYHSPPGVTGIRDRITQALSKEQSLVMQLRRLPPGGRAEARKQFGQKMNFIHYRRLKMFVHGDDDLPQQDSPLEFYIRFGPTPDIYYEYGEKVYPHWDTRNEINLDFDELTKTKLEQYLTGDSIGKNPVYFRRDPSNPEKYFKVVGKPGLHNINFIYIGARNLSGDTLEGMEIWLDEMRLTDVERDKGTAMRLSTDLTLADIASIRAQWEVVDDDFRRLEQQFASTDGKDYTKENQSYFASLRLHKFLPESWGFEIPLDAKYTRSKKIPKYYFNTDRRTHYRPTSWQDRLSSFFGLSDIPAELESSSDFSESRSIGATFKRKNLPKDPWYLRYTINQMTVDVDYAKNHSRNPNTLFSDNTSISGRFSYSLNFSKNNYFMPFSWLGKGKLVRPLAAQKLYFTPSQISTNFSVTDNEKVSQQRLQPEPKRQVDTRTTRNFKIGYKLLESLDFNLDRNYKSDAYYKGYRVDDVMNAIFKKLDFGLDQNISQNFSMNYSPRLFQWLNFNFRYNSDYNFNIRNPETHDLTSSLNISKSTSIDFRPATLAQQIYKPKPRAPGQRSSPRQKPRGRPERRGGNEPDSDEAPPRQGAEKPSEPGQEKPQSGEEKTGPEQNKQPEEKKKGGPPTIRIPNPAVLLWQFFNIWKSIKFDYQIQDNFSHYNLADMPDWRYQFGFETDPGVGIDTTFRKVLVLPGIKKSRRLRGTLDLDIMRNLTSSLTYNRDRVQSQTNQRNDENVNNSFFFLGDDPEADKKSWSNLIPDWTLRLSGVEKFLFFKEFAQSISLEHSRSGKYTESARLEEGKRIKDRWSYSISYQPFLGITINTRWGVNAAFRYNKSANYDYNVTGTVAKALQATMNLTLNYSVTKGFRLPLPFLKKKTLRNEIQFSLAFDKSSNAQYAKRAGETDFQEQDVQKSWKIRPSVSYRFSEKVNGTGFFDMGTSENKRTGKTSYKEFGINVNIAIR